MSEEEMETSDEDSYISDESTTEMEAPTRSGHECQHCGLNKLLALSHLHDTLLEPKKKNVYNLPLRTIEIGSREGCEFCGLLMDAVRVWKTEQERGNQKSTLDYKLLPRDGQWVLLLALYENDFNVAVFRGAGCQSSWNLSGAPQISGDTSSLKAAETARHWLQDCMDSHDLCNRNNPVQGAPKRILELDGKYVRLREHFQLESDYACLSHCWGPLGPAMQLMADTIDVLKAGYLMDELPKTFRDAAHFCWKLGIRYIWIDALCILQDNNEDWNEATVYMADTYEGAAVTIAATWSSSSDDGCFAPATSKMIGTALAEPGLYIAGSLLGFPRTSGEVNTPHWPLLTRAWVFQERKLSTRVLHFCKDQLFWECNSRFTSEDGLKNSPYVESESLTLEDFKFLHSRDPELEWRSAVQYYSRLKLTYEKDRMSAIAGFAKSLQKQRPGDLYVAGAWLGSLLCDLAWYGERKEPDPRPSRPGTVMPSWSWISVSSGVNYTDSTLLPSLMLINAVYDITGPAHIGQVSEASITLQGSCVFIDAFQCYGRPFEIIEYQDLFCGEDGPLLEISDIYTAWDFDYNTATFAMILQDKDKGDSDNKTLEFLIDGDGEDDWSSDDDNVIPSERIEENFVLLLLSEIEFQGDIEYFGIVLHEIEDEQFERVGSIRLQPAKRFWEGKSALRTQLAAERIASLPIRQFTIV